ncbi:MAG TPA: molybdopterin-dependent oxidoreductase [Pyrinomonadaceae bacterium]|jgi:DMSO/TMAO reductase YedYZ molybdopterin-dependent catalytic subunit|nr:molybdopterin-dependent oxidoreductase [Pyrinomonadaceae bacterium]
MIRRLLPLLLLIAPLTATVTFGQAKQTPPPVLRVAGEVARPLELTSADLAKLPRQTVKAKDHDGKVVTFEGIALVEILRLAGVEFGEKLRGKSLALFLVVEAADEYRAVYALPELDPAYNDQIIILADRRDGNALSDTEGPWRIIVPQEKRQARWVRRVVALTIRRA